MEDRPISGAPEGQPRRTRRVRLVRPAGIGGKMKRGFRRPSPAIVIAIVALIAALGGTAIAGGALNKKKVKKITNNQITKREPGLSVANAKNLGDQPASAFQSRVQWALV